MNVLHLQLTGNPGGVVTLCRSIARVSKNCNYMYFLFSGGTVADAMAKENVPVVISNTPRFQWKKSKRLLLKYCKDNQIGVILCHSNSPIAITHALFVKKYIPQIKVIMYLHGAAENIIPHGIKYLYHRHFVNKMKDAADSIVAISKYVNKSCVDQFDLNPLKVHTVYNGVDCNLYVPGNHNPGNCMELIYVGRLFPAKGVHILIDAIAKMDDPSKVRLTVVGIGPSLNELKKQVQNAERPIDVKFLGARMDIQELLNTADFFVHPAILNEGFGITLIEAMACGVPCIAFNKGAIPEIIDSGRNGFIVQSDCAEALAAQLNACVSFIGTKEYLDMKKQAREDARKFDIRNTVSDLEKLYC